MLIKFHRLPLAAAFLVAALLTAASQNGLKVGDLLPDLAAYKLEGKLPDPFQGKVVLLDFWASWCEPCRLSFPVMEELQKRYGSRGFVIIAVNEDENRSDMENFLKKNPVSFAVVRDPGQKLVGRAEVAAMPGSFVFDRQSRVRYVHVGFHGSKTSKQYTEEIEALLKQ
jgi:cytochrome c biogenesis protein CcmG, thiol:disulfide interchange protein DsbE